MSELVAGTRSDTCLNCHENYEAIKRSRNGMDNIYCAEVDYFGECVQEWPRHRFVITKAYIRSVEAEAVYWENEAKRLEAGHAE